ARAIALVLLIRARHGDKAPSLSYLLATAAGRGVEGLFAAQEHELAVLTAEQRDALALRSIATTCGALYGGKSHCKMLFGFDPPAWAPERGLWEREDLLADAALLREVDKRFALALFTGRNPGEAELALI